MEFQEVVRTRRMCRNYTDEPVDPAVVDLALANATRAPNAGFTQGWAFVVLDTPEAVARFWETTTDPSRPADRWLRGMRQAPVLILPCSSKQAYLDRYALPDKGWEDRDEARWPMPFWHLDAAMASLLILQTATDHGLGSCFFGVSSPRAVKDTFGIPESHEPVGVISLGHPAATTGAKGSPARRRRRPLEELVHRGGW